MPQAACSGTSPAKRSADLHEPHTQNTIFSITPLYYVTIVCGPGLYKSGCPAFSPFALFAQLAVWRISLSGFAVHLRMISGTYTLICIVSVVVNALTYYYYNTIERHSTQVITLRQRSGKKYLRPWRPLGGIVLFRSGHYCRAADNSHVR